MPPGEPGLARSKHRIVYEFLREKIVSGEFPPGEQLPTEHELALHFGMSRPTVARALNDLESTGLIDRRAGAGSFVLERRSSEGKKKVLGLLIPGLGDTEIFEPICGRIAAEAEKNHAILMWASGIDQDGDISDRLLGTVQYFIETAVDGVFFAPLEFRSDLVGLNNRLIQLLTDAGIPVVLMDRDFLVFPERSEFDRVGLDHFRAGYVMCQHLIDLGVREIHFLARPGSASTVTDRINGCRLATMDADVPGTPLQVHWGEPDDIEFLRDRFSIALTQDRTPPPALICANDRTASQFLKSASPLNFQVPRNILLASFDDVKYASFLSPSLTTLAQPCEAIGRAAFNAMMTRIAHPDLPARDILIQGHLQIRDSTRIP